MRYRILVLPVAALVIIGLVIYKSNRTYRELTPEERTAVQTQRPAPQFALHDQKSQLFRLARYSGRHKLVIAFFDPTDGADRNPQLQILKEGISRLTAHGEKVIAISAATPFANRNAFARGGDFPFHILSDPDYSVQTQWGCMTPGDPPKMVPAVFVVDRVGIIHWSRIGGTEPVTVETLEQQLAIAR
jgi:peroxiredoxin